MLVSCNQPPFFGPKVYSAVIIRYESGLVSSVERYREEISDNYVYSILTQLFECKPMHGRYSNQVLNTKIHKTIPHQSHWMLGGCDQGINYSTCQDTICSSVFHGVCES